MIGLLAVHDRPVEHVIEVMVPVGNAVQVPVPFAAIAVIADPAPHVVVVRLTAIVPEAVIGLLAVHDRPVEHVIEVTVPVPPAAPVPSLVHAVFAAPLL